MPKDFQFRPDRTSAPLLASAIVLVLGAVGATVVVLSTGQNPYVGLLIFIGLAFLVPLLGFALRATPQRTLSSMYSWIRGAKADPADEYKPRAVRQNVNYGTKLPPSATDLKEMKSGTNNWVPSNVSPPSKKPKK